MFASDDGFAVAENLLKVSRFIFATEKPNSVSNILEYFAIRIATLNGKREFTQV